MHRLFSDCASGLQLLGPAACQRQADEEQEAEEQAAQAAQAAREGEAAAE